MAKKGFLGANPDLADLVQCLSKHKVRYMVIGGHAVGYYAKPRATKDLDLWIDSSEENRERLIQALEEYGVPPSVLMNFKCARQDEIVWFGRPPNRVDILQTLSGVSFDDVFLQASFTTSGSEMIPIIPKDALIKNKALVAREQDLADIKALKGK